MQANMINQTLLNNWGGYNGFGVTVQELAGKVREWYVYEPYFFLRKELDVTRETWNEFKRDGKIRHCKIYRGKWLDYVVRKEFNTFQEWLNDAGGRIEDVLYGENRVRDNEIRRVVDGRLVDVPKTPKYVELSVLLRHLGYVEPPRLEIPAVPQTRDLNDLIEIEMRMRGLSIDNVWVIDGGMPVQWKTFTAQ